MKEPKPRCSGTMTESQYLAWIRSALRSKSLKWKPRSDCINAAKRPYKGSNKLQKWEVECALCKNWFKLKEIHVDHFPKEAGSILSVDDIGQFCNNLFCEADNLRCLCEGCHSVHTLASRNNISWEDALLEKDVNNIMREKKEDIIQFILDYDWHNEYNTNNEANRKAAVRSILKGVGQMRAKCIRNYSDINHFNVGQIYEVRQSGNLDLFDVLVEDTWSMGWCKTRFELLDDAFPESMKNLNTTSLAQHLTSKLFELGNEGDKLTNRISFMVGTYGVDEECAGGMNKVALEKFFERVIANFKEEL